MNSTRLNRQLANRTGEPLSLIRRIGFQLKSPPTAEPHGRDIVLGVRCPFCRGTVPYPGRSRDGSTALAECDRCDIYFPVDECDVFPTTEARIARRAPARRDLSA